MKAILFACLILISLNVSAQIVSVRDNTIDVETLFLGEVNKNEYNSADGSPYISNTFVPAKINDLKKTQFIRFNVVDQIVEVKTKENKAVMLDLTHDYQIKMLDGSNKQYATATYYLKGKSRKSFFEIVKQTESYILYKQERRKFIKEQKAEGYQDKTPARFVDVNPMYFVSDFKKESGHLLELPAKKKKFTSFFGSRSKAMGQFIKKEKLNSTKEEDLIAIFDFYFQQNL